MSKIEIGKTYRTRDGREVRIYVVDGPKPYSVHGAIKDDGCWGPPQTWSDGGIYRIDYGDHPRDLIEVKPRIKRTVWLNVYDDKRAEPNAVSAHRCRGRADDAAGRLERIACIPVEIDCEHGEGLS